jgi:hypothetical protein
MLGQLQHVRREHAGRRLEMTRMTRSGHVAASLTALFAIPRARGGGAESGPSFGPGRPPPISIWLDRGRRALTGGAGLGAVQPDATGEAIGSTEWGRTIVEAFAEAAALALLSIAILLWIVLRRLTDVLVTLTPLLVAGIVTLEICALAKFQLNYANIIALPVLLGIGVAFKIYYVTAWRRGQSNFLQSVLTRAVFYSTLLTATAFGSLWLSNQPGISSMGKLLALSFLNRKNFFAKRNVTAIVIQLPNNMIGNGLVHGWASASLHGHAPEVEVSRWGLPLVTNVFMPDQNMREE